MILHTASEGVTLAKKLEGDSAKFYEEIAKKYSAAAESLLGFANQNKKNIAQIDRVYYGVITDAIEGSYAFNLESDNYVLDTKLSAKASISEAVKKAKEIEGVIVKFYNEAAEQSQSLMADVPRTFKVFAKKRAERTPVLDSLVK
jgi:hypothetical protein